MTISGVAICPLGTAIALWLKKQPECFFLVFHIQFIHLCPPEITQQGWIVLSQPGALQPSVTRVRCYWWFGCHVAPYIWHSPLHLAHPFHKTQLITFWASLAHLLSHKLSCSAPCFKPPVIWMTRETEKAAEGLSWHQAHFIGNIKLSPILKWQKCLCQEGVAEESRTCLREK